MLKHIPFYGTLLGRPLTPRTNATHSHVLVYGAIEAHSLGNKGCIASNSTIATETGLKENSVKTIISLLAKAKWVGVKLDKNNHRRSVDPLMDINPPVNGDKPPLQSPLTQKGDLTDTNLVLEDSKENTVREPKLTKVSLGATSPARRHEQELLNLTNTITGRSFRVLPRGSTKTLKLFGLNEIGTALHNLKHDPWHKERIKELSLDYLLRATTIDKFLTQHPPLSRIGALLEQEQQRAT